jgi:hypothetical protein
MKVGVVGLLGLAAALVTPTVAGQSLSETEFHFFMTIGQTRSELYFPTTEHKRILLPAVFDDWNCIVTDRQISNDGASVYHNLVCTEATHLTFMTGMTISCPRVGAGHEENVFFLRSNTEAGVSSVLFYGSCVSRAAPPPAPAPPTKKG